MHTFLIFYMVFGVTLGQSKFEKEERINREELPKTVKELLPLIDGLAKRTRYYRETDGAKKSYEIKFKHHKSKYSVEFDDDGTLEDIEVVVSQSDVPQSTLLLIENDLRNDFTRFKFKKIQEQFSYPNGLTPAQTIKSVIKGTLAITGYEIVVSGKTKTGHERYEFFFDDGGHRIKKRKILSRGYDHIMF